MNLNFSNLTRFFSNALAKILALVFISSGFTQLSAAELGNLTPKQLEQKQNALVIDIRTEKEWQDSGIIPNSHKLQFYDQNGKFDATAWVDQLNQLKQTPDQTVILVCRSGNRSSTVGNFLANKKGMENVFHLQNGIKSWLQAGKKLQQ